MVTIRQSDNIPAVPTLPAVDLNLLGPLDALLQERHVSRAAEVRHMSQPAMSRALRALRDVFADELLVRGPDGYRLTPRAERLQRELATALPQLDSLFSGEPFDPRTAAHVYRLAGTDYVLSVIGPALLAAVRARSPSSTLHFGGWHHGVFQDLERGAFDLAFIGGAAPAPLRTEVLFDDHYVCVLSSRHPLAGEGAIALDDYLRCEHVLVNVTDGRQGIVDNRLEALGRPRRAAVSVPYHALAAGLVADTDLVATLPWRGVDGLGLSREAVAIMAAPAELDPTSFSIAWHPRLDDDPAQQWLRETIRTTAAHAAVDRER